MSNFTDLLVFLKKNEERQIPFTMLMKGTSIIILAPAMLLAILVIRNEIDLETAYYGMIFVFVVSIIFVRPYIANLSSLTYYVRQLSLDKKASAPDLSFLNNVEELSAAVEQLHISWGTRKRQLETALAESKILIDSLPDMIFMVDKKQKVIRTNSRAKTVLGGKYFDKSISEIIDNEEISALITMVLEDGEGRNSEVTFDRPTFSTYFVRIERFPVYSQGGIAIIIVLHDITKQKETERMLSDFVANASHEIRTPLTSIMGFIETLQTSAKDDKEVRDKFLGIMASQAERMSKLVSGLLSISQLERNINTKPTGTVNITHLLREAQAYMSITADEKDITINLDIKHEIKSIIGDMGELSQVIENLLSNAIKYGRHGSIITIRAGLVKNTFDNIANLRKSSKILSIEFVDEGEGIRKDHIPRLTERFYCVDQARTRKIGGTGLGLSIVHYIIERHKGALLIESEVGVGSKFTVLLSAD